MPGRSVWPFWVLVLLGMAQGGLLYGQIQQPTMRADTIPRQAGTGQDEDEGPLPPDTIGLFRLYPSNPFQETPYSDTALHGLVQQYDPARERKLDYATLGNLGSAARPIVFELPFRRGFDPGLRQFDIYLIPLDSLPFYRLGRAYTDLAYFRGAEQADGYIKARLNSNFGKSINLSIDYERISQLGENNQFPNQNTRNTALATGAWLKSRSGAYQVFLGASFNTIQQEDNGGILEEPLVDDEFASPQSATVFLQDAQSRYNLRQVGLRQHLRMALPRNPKRVFLLSHAFTFGSYRYKFADDRVTADTSFYQRFPAFGQDVRGVRFLLEGLEFSNQADVQFFVEEPGGNFEPRKQRGLLKVGLRHSASRWNQEPFDSVVNNLFLIGQAAFRPNPRLDVEVFGHFGLWDNAGDYRVAGRLRIPLGKVAQFEAGAENQLFSPNWMQRQLILTERFIWRRDLAKTVATKLQASIRFPGIGLEVRGQYQLLNNYIYFDTLGLPQQARSPVNVAQLILSQPIRLWRFTLDNTLALQTSSEDFIRLPALFGKHSFYYRGTFFRVLRVKVGLDLRYATRYFPDYYQPVTGQFILQDGREAPFYPSTDGYFALRVTKFRAFIKWENMERLFISDRFFYLSGFYPVPTGPGIRIGIRWRFEN